MTYQNIHNEQLCNKLRNEFSYRVETKINESRNVKRSSACINVRPGIRDVGVQQSGELLNNSYKKVDEADFENRIRYSHKPNVNNNYKSGDLSAVSSVSQPFDYIYNKYSARRAYNKAFNEKIYLRNNPEAKKVEKVKEKKSFSAAFSEYVYDLVKRDDDENEGKVVHNSLFSLRLIACIVFVTAAFMLVLSTNSAYSRELAEVKELRDEQAVLLAEKDRLVNLLSIKDDIREIEDFAVNEIGMVKSDYVETRTVSVAGGEHIDVINADVEENANIFSTLLSALGSNLETIKDYVD